MGRTKRIFGQVVGIFWSQVEVRGVHECWLWKGRCVDGYSMFAADGATGEWVMNGTGHRFSLALHLKRSLAANEFALHTCDNPRCVNPGHLYLGDHAVNMKDKVEKGRHARGETHGASVLRSAEVAELRVLSQTGWWSPSVLSRAFGTSTQNVLLIISGMTWKHLP